MLTLTHLQNDPPPKGRAGHALCGVAEGQIHVAPNGPADVARDGQVQVLTLIGGLGGLLDALEQFPVPADGQAPVR